MSAPLLTLTEAGFRYDATRWIFRNVDLQVHPGEVLAILGRNGVGKSTLLNALIGLRSLTEGTVLLGEDNLAKLTPGERARKVAYLPQMESSGISYTVSEYLLMGRAPYIGLFSHPSKDDRARVLQIIAELGLIEFAHSQVDQLSGGQRQQVGIGRTLVQDAPLIVLDEPTSALDLANQAKVLRKLRQLRDAGYGIIFTTHNPDHTLMLNAKVALLGAHAHADEATTQDPVHSDNENSASATPGTSKEPAQLLTGEASEVLSGDILTRTFGAPLSVIYSAELDRKTVHITSIS